MAPSYEALFNWGGETMIRDMTSRLALAAVLMAATATGAMAQTAQPERREAGSLVFDGIPQIPASLKPQLARYRNAAAPASRASCPTVPS